MPLWVWVGLNDPQDPVGVQVQFTPALRGSLATFAVSGDVALICKDEGGAGLKVTVMGATLIMAIVADAEAEESATEVAITVTLPPLGTVAGAV